MTIRTLKFFLAAFALTVASFAQQPDTLEEGQRLALVIGNDAYSIRPLQNAVNDARAMQKALAGSGFRVNLQENAGRVAIETAVAEFLSKLGPGDTALLYYAGHALQIEGENVLIPADFESARSIIDAKIKSFSLSLVFNEFRRSRARRLIVIIDACRTNPVAETHSLKAGLANPTDAGKNTYIAFSTSPGNVAGDNPNGRNSWFTEALAEAVDQPNLTLDDVFNRVRLKVENATGGKQTPWSITSLTSKFYFHPPKDALAASAVADQSLLAKWYDDALRQAQYGNWREAVEIGERILKQKQGGPVEEAATARLPYWRVREEAEIKFAAGDFAGAAARQEAAMALEPFDVDAALEASNAALLLGDTARATKALGAIRLRGASVHVKRAEAMLKELAAMDPVAAASLKQPLAKPPPVQELFPGYRFGLPDFAAGRRWVSQASAAVDFAAVAKQLPPPPAPPPAPVAKPVAEPAVLAQAAPVESDEPRITLDDLYVDVKSVAGARDLVTEELGELTIRSARPGMGVKLEGRAVSRKLPFNTKLPPGEYEIRIVDSGKKVSERRVRVKSGAVTELELPR